RWLRATIRGFVNKPSPPLALLVRIFLNAFFAKRESFAAKRGEKSPHSRLQRKKNNRQPACPEREAA
ncbi:hypothetical protein, partial [Alistipes shahii]|uniref:hypothetical protein n=2 Tax=Alistipes shahii TaxID=328814 RepID=UPI0034A45BFE